MTTLTEQEFLNEVLNHHHLKGCLEHVDDDDLECVYRIIKQDYREGVSVEDCANSIRIRNAVARVKAMQEIFAKKKS